MVMTHMCCEMQNKLSKTGVSPLGSMGYIISSRCPYIQVSFWLVSHTCSIHQIYSSSVSPFQAYTGTPVLAMAAAAKSCVENILQLDHCTCKESI